MQPGNRTPLYETIGATYAGTRVADPRMERLIWNAVGDARTVVNVGAGTGNYEPTDRAVIAVEPSTTMLAQRKAAAAPAVRAVAEALPFRDQSFDAAMAVLTLHHWSDLAAGLSELRRVARSQVILLFELALNHNFWLFDYFPDVRLQPSETQAPGVADVAQHLEVQSVTAVPVPADCSDGFAGAFWRRPEAYLDPLVRQGISALARLPEAMVRRGAERLAHDLSSGAWDERYGFLRSLEEYDLGYRLVVGG